MTSDKAYTDEVRHNALVTQLGTGAYPSTDGNNYDWTRLTLVVPFGANVSINSAVTPVTIFTKPLGVGTYRIEAWLVTSNATAANAAGFAFAFSGTAPSALVDYDSIVTGGANYGYFGSATLTSQFNSQGVGGNQRVHVNLTLLVTVAGTLKLTGIELVTTVVTVFGGSRMDICRVVAT